MHIIFRGLLLVSHVQVLMFSYVYAFNFSKDDDGLKQIFLQVLYIHIVNMYLYLQCVRIFMQTIQVTTRKNYNMQDSRITKAMLEIFAFFVLTLLMLVVFLLCVNYNIFVLCCLRQNFCKFDRHLKRVIRHM